MRLSGIKTVKSFNDCNGQRTRSIQFATGFATMLIAALFFALLMTACDGSDNKGPGPGPGPDPVPTVIPDALVWINTNSEPCEGGSCAAAGLEMLVNRQLCDIDLTSCCSSGGQHPPCYYNYPYTDVAQSVLSVVDREDLSLQRMTVYTSDQLSDLNTDLLNLKQNSPDEVFAIVQLPGGLDGSEFQAGLEAIGFDGTYNTSAQSLSVLGIPGMVEGKAASAEQPANSQNPAWGVFGWLRQASIVKNGILDTAYVFEWPLTEPFSTRAGSNSNQNTVTIGNNTVVSKVVDSGSSGLHLVTFELNSAGSNSGPYSTLSIVVNETYQTTNGLDWSQVETAVQSAHQAGHGVSLVTIGTALDKNPVNVNDFNALLGELEGLGVNPDVFARSVKAGAPYSMISASGAGYQSSAVMATFAGQDCTGGVSDLPVCKGALAGELRQNSTHGVIPTAVDPGGIAVGTADNPLLTQILYQPWSAWPLTAPVGGEASGGSIALAWLAKTVESVDTAVTIFSATQSPNLCGTGISGRKVTAADGKSNSYVCDANVRQVALDLRTQYTNVDQTFSHISPSQPYQSSYPFTGCTDISSCETSELADAVNQLNKEFLARTRTLGFFDFLNTPFVDDEGNVNTTLQDIAVGIVKDGLGAAGASLTPNSSAWVGGIVTSALVSLSSVTDLVEGVTLFEDLTKYLILAGSGGASISTAIGGPPGESAAVEYILLESQLVETAIEVDSQIEFSLLQQAMGNENAEVIVLSDWDKMNTVASNWINGPWELSGTEVTDMTTSMINAYTISVRQQAYYAYLSEYDQVAAAHPANGGSGWPGFPGDPETAPWLCWLQYTENDDSSETGWIATFTANGGSDNKNHDFSTLSIGNGGIGDGQVYLPLAAKSIWTGADEPENVVVYNFSTGWNGSKATKGKATLDGLTGQGYEYAVSLGLMQNIASQPADFKTASDVSAGAYPPTFWFNAFSMKALSCPGESNPPNAVDLSADGSLYQWLSN